jgi:hypothetical protein
MTILAHKFVELAREFYGTVLISSAGEPALSSPHLNGDPTNLVRR